MQKKCSWALVGLVVAAGCTPQPPSYTSPPSTQAYSAPSETRPIAIRSTSDRARDGANWARDQIRSGTKKPLSVADAQTYIRRAMRDPESVRFRNVRAFGSTGAVCGLYNAKNGYGGYVGETPFVYYHSPDHSVPQFLYGSDIRESISIFSTWYCK